jgi:hypothetical protein
MFDQVKTVSHPQQRTIVDSADMRIRPITKLKAKQELKERELGMKIQETSRASHTPSPLQITH